MATRSDTFDRADSTSLGADWAEHAEGDNWTLYSEPRAPTVQYEHTVVATANGPLVLTLPR